MAVARNPAPEMIAARLPDNTMAMATLRRATIQFYNRPVMWNPANSDVPGMTWRQAYDLVCELWSSTYKFTDIPVEIWTHAIYQYDNRFKWTTTLEVDAKGLMALLPLVLACGPFGVGPNPGHVRYSQFSFPPGPWQNGYLANYPIPDEIRYGFVVPILRQIQRHGDQEGAAGDWMAVFEGRSVAGYVKDQLVKAKEGVTSWEWLQPRLSVSHPDYSNNPTRCREMKAGINFRVGLILRYLSPNFPLPNKMTRWARTDVRTRKGGIRLTNEQYYDYLNRIVRDHNGVALPNLFPAP